MLDVPALTYARKVELDGSTVKIEQQTAAGYNEVEAPTPVLLSLTAGVVEPRYPTFKGIMAAKSKPVDQLTLSDLGVDIAGAGQEILSVTEAPGREAGVKIEDEGEAHLEVVAKLQELKVV